jgi:hypothetical protein
MSFVTTDTAAIATAAGTLQGIGSTLSTTAIHSGSYDLTELANAAAAG